MKYTIEGFSQQKLLEMKLDTSDALILRWFADFSASGAMRFVTEKGKQYFLVKYDGILRDLPILGISTNKAVAQRMDKYVGLGILEKVVRTGGSFHGSSTFFRATEKFLSLTYSQTSDKADAKEQSHDKASGHTKESDTKTTSKNDSSQNFSEKKFDGNREIPERKFEGSRHVPIVSELPAATGSKLPVGLNNSSTRNSSTNNSYSSTNKKAETAYDADAITSKILSEMGIETKESVTNWTDLAQKTFYEWARHGLRTSDKSIVDWINRDFKNGVMALKDSKLSSEEILVAIKNLGRVKNLHSAGESRINGMPTFPSFCEKIHKYADGSFDIELFRRKVRSGGLLGIANQTEVDYGETF